MNDRATFVLMEASTHDDWRKIGAEFSQPRNNICKAATAVVGAADTAAANT